MKNEAIVLIGGGGHALSIADTIERNGEFCIAGYTDCSYSAEFPHEYLGNDDILPQLYSKGIKYAAVSLGYMGNNYTRDRLYKKLKEIGFIFPPIVDRDAIVSTKTIIGEGTFIGKGTVINTSSIIGKMCIINTGAIIEHQNSIGDFSHISCGAVLCGNVSIGQHCLIGAGTTIIQGIKIDDNVIVGAGSIITKPIKSGKKIIQKRKMEECDK